MTSNRSLPLRARSIGIPFNGTPGQLNAITDVVGVRVGHTTLIEGEGDLKVGVGPVRTGVSMILPRGYDLAPVFAAWYSLNGNGEMTGTTWIEESGFLDGPIALTNTHSVGLVRDAIIAWQVQRKQLFRPESLWSLPVVAETYDGVLNDINGFHVKPEHVFAALDSAADGSVPEGAVGGGTGMICHQFKGGIGTASRIVQSGGDYTLGVMVQANYGLRHQLTLGGVPVGMHLVDDPPIMVNSLVPPGAGSIIVVVATDAPLLPHQLKQLVRRVPIGIGRLGGIGAHTSGDIFVAFSTANSEVARESVQRLDMLSNDLMSPFFTATIEATEEAIANCLVAAPSMVGINGNSVPALPHERVREILRQYRRLVE